MRIHNVVILVFLSLFVSVSVAAKEKEETLVGGWSPIKDINDPHVAEIAKFAVIQYDQHLQSGKKLSLVKTIKGETQVVAGTNYRLVLAANDGSATKNYEAVVWEKPWAHFKNLTSFKPLD